MTLGQSADNTNLNCFLFKRFISKLCVIDLKKLSKFIETRKWQHPSCLAETQKLGEANHSITHTNKSKNSGPSWLRATVNSKSRNLVLVSVAQHSITLKLVFEAPGEALHSLLASPLICHPPPPSPMRLCAKFSKFLFPSEESSLSLSEIYTSKRSGAPNDSFHPNSFKTLFRLSRVCLDL